MTKHVYAKADKIQDKKHRRAFDLAYGAPRDEARKILQRYDAHRDVFGNRLCKAVLKVSRTLREQHIRRVHDIQICGYCEVIDAALKFIELRKQRKADGFGIRLA